MDEEQGERSFTVSDKRFSARRESGIAPAKAPQLPLPRLSAQPRHRHRTVHHTRPRPRGSTLLRSLSRWERRRLCTLAIFPIR
jgi:hypothetical protein